MSERTWLASTSSARIDDVVCTTASRQLPTATAASDAANASQRHGHGRGRAAGARGCGGLAQRGAHAPPQGLRGLEPGHPRGDGRAQREAVIAEAPAGRAAREVRLELDRVARGELAVEVRVDLRFHVRVGHIQRSLSGGDQGLLEALAGAREPRHDRADRHVHHLADLLVGQPLDLAQHDHLSKLGRQVVERLRQRFARVTSREQRFRVLVGDRLAVHRLVELGRRRVRAMPAPPGMGHVPDDREQPCPALARPLPAEAAEILEGAQTRLLHDIVGVGVVPRQVARQPVGGAQVRQHHGFESFELAWLQDRSSRCVAGQPSRRGLRGRRVYSRRNRRGGGRSLPLGRYCCHPNMRNTRMRQTLIAVTRTVAGLLLVGALVAAMPARRDNPVPVSARLSEWTIQLSEATVPAGPVTFTVTNGGSIPHALEVEGQGTEQETPLIQPGASATLTLTLEPGTYEVYCPVGEDSHKKLGMETHLKVVGAGGRDELAGRGPEHRAAATRARLGTATTAPSSRSG